MSYRRRKAVNLMHRGIKLVIADEVIAVDTRPLLRGYSGINFGRRLRSERKLRRRDPRA